MTDRGIEMKVVRRWIGRTGRNDERGDVPGWVMITVMSAGLVAIIAAAAGPQLRSMLTQALSAVGG